MSPAEPVIAERSVDMEALQAKIQGEIEAKLAQKEDSLWRRGQVEIKKLQQEQREVLQAVSTMQEQQAILVTENQLLRGHLAEVTGKFEEVVSKMRTVLRSLPAGQQQLLQQQLPSVIAEKVPGAEADPKAAGSGPARKGIGFVNMADLPDSDNEEVVSIRAQTESLAVEEDALGNWQAFMDGFKEGITYDIVGNFQDFMDGFKEGVQVSLVVVAVVVAVVGVLLVAYW
eukprot:TRINITY_DN14226_c0_g2_i4.p1 TRINITY_DN14226_c0_g2~~TRINITY_DN14226_c0_g2_i4.p1  ORF type:complete len:229 (-),score=70.83 TRINITY_DN14226_c0_g2_i4:28-714(-)